MVVVGVCRLAPRVWGGSWASSSDSFHCYGDGCVCGFDVTCVERTILRRLPYRRWRFRCWLLSGRGLMKQKQEPLGCTWSVTWFHTAHDFSSTSVDDTKAHRVCDLEIKILSASKQKCLQGSSRRRFPCSYGVICRSFRLFARKDDLFSSCWIEGCVEPHVNIKPDCLRGWACALAGIGHAISKPEIVNCCKMGLCKLV